MFLKGRALLAAEFIRWRAKGGGVGRGTCLWFVSHHPLHQQKIRYLLFIVLK